MKSYNLLDESWLPVRYADGQVKEVGLLTLFADADLISALAETAPPSLIALYRLLLAITHRAFTRQFGNWTAKDMAGYYRGGLPVDVMHEYLEHWRERFYVFHPEWPFMQVAALATAEETRAKSKSWTQIALASSNGNAPVLFELDCAALKQVNPIAAKPVSKFQPVRRDLALVVDESLPVATLTAAFRSIANPLITAIELFDVYRGKGVAENRKSLAFKVLLQDTHKTLTEGEVDAAIADIIRKAEECGASLRV